MRPLVQQLRNPDERPGSPVTLPVDDWVGEFVFDLAVERKIGQRRTGKPTHYFPDENGGGSPTDEG